MKINVIFSHNNYDELFFASKTSVVIDVLRASSTIVTALQNGAKEIIPVASVEFAVKISGGLFTGQTLMCGERNTKKIEGFALGNSPLEFTEDKIAGKSIILYTTNGSKAVVKAKFSENLFITTFLNLSAVANKLIEVGKDTEIICSGRGNAISLEDIVCAGKLVSEIQKNKEEIELSDSSKASISLNKTFGKNIHKMLKDTEHGQILIKNGFEKDIEYCSKLDLLEAVPVFTNNALRLLSAVKSVA
ncbi:MAG: 2-phosphosulfolactate phosphatase [Ignavibacteriaceae bacterium]|jgi:2-phosphosulfolactate phosphatase